MGNTNIPQVYDRNRNRLAFLNAAFDIHYSLQKNSLYTAGFSLSADDPKNQYCQPYNLVEIYDGDKRIELFRIIGEDLTRSTEAVKSYTCEHILASLMNDILFQYHQLGNVGYYTVNVIRYILDRQTVKNWQLYQCDFSRQFEYKWENENLLAALFAIPECFDEDYIWQYDTTVYPYRISLKRPSSTIKSEIRYLKNMREIKKTVDAANVITRLYCLGYGEGDNQLTIESVNDGVPYLDADTQSTYGIINGILTDRRFESPETLKAYGQTLLNEYKTPYLSYEASTIDLYRLTGNDFDNYKVGDMVRVIDSADGIAITAPIVKVEKSDITGNPADIKITIANKDRNIAGSISDLQSRQRINETYAQGATNISMQNFADNADAANPATFKVYIPEETARINKLILSVSFEAFRGYTKSIDDGGNSTVTSASGGGSTQTSEGGGGVTENTGTSGIDVTYAYFDTESAGDPAHTHEMRMVNSHKHRITLDDHMHSVSIPSHKHSVSIPSHTHDIEFGIYEGSSAVSATIFVDGVQMPAIADYNMIDIVNYLATDNDGRIQRNTWHTIEIKPNTMTRISASLFMQLFCQSRGGVDL